MSSRIIALLVIAVGVSMILVGLHGAKGLAIKPAASSGLPAGNYTPGSVASANSGSNAG